MNQHATALLLVTFLPLATALAIAIAQPLGRQGLSRWLALAGASATLIVSLQLAGPVLGSPGEYTARVSVPWIQSWGISFSLGMDGLSGLLVLLTNFLMVISILASWTAVHHRTCEFYAILMLLHAGINGTFLALDLVLFYVFWEMMLVPLYFLIGIFGSGNRIYATMKFFLYTMAGSVLMLIGILTLYFSVPAALEGMRSFAIEDLVKGSQSLSPGLQKTIFLSFFLAFAIKVPLFPLHTWLPDAHTEAPTAGSIILAGVLLKTGVYGMLRFAIPLFPAVASELAPLIMTLSVIAIVYGALTALVQTDMKRLVAYSSVSHMGFIMLGVFSFREEALAGAMIQMLSHGISTGALFFCVGTLYERRHTRELADFGGLAHNLKCFSTFAVIVTLSSVGLPGLCGFVGEFLILLGVFQVQPELAAIATTGVIFAAVYLLRLLRYTIFGPLSNEENKKLKDLGAREVLALGALMFFAFWIGLYPKPYLAALSPVSKKLPALIEKAKQPVAEPAAPQGRRQGRG